MTEVKRNENVYSGSASIRDTDFLIEVQKGNVKGHAIVQGIGLNDEVPNGSFATINPLGSITWRTSASTVRIKAGGDAADTSDGLGAQSITVRGIGPDVTGVLSDVSESITTAGALASASTTQTFWRINSAWVEGSGAYGVNNIGDIVIEDSAGEADMIKINALEGESQSGAFTIPDNHSGVILSVLVTAGAKKPVDVRLFSRTDFDVVSAPFAPSRLKLFWYGLEEPLPFSPQGPSNIYPEKSDIWFEARAGKGGGQVSVNFELLLVENVT